jgi:electron transfer flavoprotein beta subunit
LKVIVCIKQVPDISEIEVKMNSNTHTLSREEMPAIINPFDMYAIEEGVRIKEKYGAEVIAISMGPLQAEKVLREAIALGVDRGILLSDKLFKGADTLVTAKIIGEAIKLLSPFDLILCGRQALDGDTAQVPIGISEILNIPGISYVRKIVKITKKEIKVERLTEYGIEEIISQLPILLSVVKEINEPRLTSLKGKLFAKKVKIEIFGKKKLKLPSNEIGLKGSPTQVVKTFIPSHTRKGKIFHPPTEEAIKEVIKILKK